MISVARRQALIFAAAMAAASMSGALMRPKRLADDDQRLELERLFPAAFGSWRTDIAAAAFVRADTERTVERGIYDQVFERTYVNAAGWRVMLSVAYGGEQTAGLELHWPEVCYRYGGFSVRREPGLAMTAGGASFAVSRLFAERPGRPEPITYWVVLGGEAIADASTYRLRRLDHAVRRSVPDGLLVRVSSIDPDVDRAFSLQAAFIDEMLLALPPADRRRVVGAQTERIRLPA